MKKFIIANFIIGLILVVLPTSTVAYKAPIKPIMPSISTIEGKIQKIFGNDSKIAIAVFKHESGLKLNQKGWNCWYYNKNGTKYSTSCRIQDRSMSWSVDCGIGQVNVIGNICPTKLLTLEGNMEEVSKIYQAQGLSAWVSYTSGAYKIYL